MEDSQEDHFPLNTNNKVPSPPNKIVNNNTVAQLPNLSFTNTIHSSFCNLLLACNNESSWEPKILMDISVPKSIHQLLGTSPITSSSVDLVPFTTQPSLTASSILENMFHYPKGCTLYFEGYDGIENANRLKKDIIIAAARDGKILSVVTKDDYKACGNK